jgi:Bacterial Ig-like domain (group 3)/FG-GAP-like repeat
MKFNRRLAWCGAALVAAATAIAVVSASQSTLQFIGMNTVFGLSSKEKSGLIRQPNCSLTQYGFSFSTLMIVPATNFQDTLHQQAGLTTKPDVFAKGCKDPALGIASTATAFLGTTTTGFLQSAQAGTDASPDLITYMTKLLSLQYTSTTLATNIPPQILAVDLNKDGFIDLIATGITDPISHQTGVGVYLNKGDGTFKPVIVYPMTTSATQSFIIDDVNGDGVPDILVQNGPSGGATQLTALIGKGDGTFTVGPSTALSLNLPLQLYGVSNTLATGDFNGDGKIDVVTADGKLYLGNGDGSFKAPTQALPVLYATTTALAAGDFNGDGKLDLAQLITGVNPSGTLIVFLGKGDGTFTQGMAYDAMPEGVALVATDLDGDGNVDLVISRESNGMFLAAGLGHNFTQANTWGYQALMGHGDGTFNGAPVTLASAAGISISASSAQSNALGDFNKDGHLDLLAPTVNGGAGTPANLSILPGKGDGSFGAAVVSSTSIAAMAVAVADFNGDGNLDAVAMGSTAAGVMTIGVLFGHGDNTLTGEIDYALPTGSTGVGLVVGDFNGDGLQDIAATVTCGAGTCTSGVYVLYGQANHTFSAPALLTSAPVLSDGATQMILAAGDVNGDSIDDIVVVNAGFLSGNGLSTDGSIHVYLGKSNNTFTAITPTVPALYFTDVALADINKDGKLDIVTGADDVMFNTQVDILLGHGDGTFAAATQTLIAGGIEDPSPVIAVADFDGDGHPDVAFFLAGSFSGILFGSGTGTLPTQVNMPVFSPIFPSEPRAVDLNGDGKPDLLFNETNTASVVSFINRWGASTGGASATTTALTASPNPAAVGATVTLTASVTSAATGAPSGTVTFLDGSSVVGTSAVAAGKATLAITTLAAGTHSLTASYSGDSTFADSVSGAVSVAVSSGAADFSIAAAPTSGSVAAGAAATSTLTLTPSNGFEATVTLACSGLPAGAACSFSPASVALSGVAATSTLTISTAAATAQLSPAASPNPLDPFLPSGTVLAAAMTPWVWRRRPRRRAAATRAVHWFGMLIFCGVALYGCHSGHNSYTPPPTGTPAGNYSVTITATSGTTSHAVTYALTVT